MRVKYLIILLSATFAACNVQAGTTWYVDGGRGSDENRGTSMRLPFKTLEKLNSMVFEPGDRILFRAGTSYRGQFEPKGSGNVGAPILVNMYGEGDKPRIEGRGEKQHALLLDGVEYWDVSGLEITNTGPEPRPARNGVVVNARDAGELHHIYLHNLTVHGVNGSCVKNEGAGNGIYWSCGGEQTPTRFVDLRIEDCHIYDCQRNGITGNGNTDRDKWYPSLGVIVRGNLIERVPGDGIVPIGCDGALVEWNVVRDSPDLLRIEDAAAGIWPWGSDNTVIQYNEVSGQNSKWDGQGFDSDYNCRGTIIRYNFSHDNAGGFLMICNEGNTLGRPYNIGTSGTRVYGNVSIDDGVRAYPTRPGWFSPTIHISGPSDDSVIEDNLAIIFAKPGREIDRTLIEMDNWGGSWPTGLIMRRNHIWIFDPLPYRIRLGASTGVDILDNDFHGSFEGMDVTSSVNAPDLKGELPLHPDFPGRLRERVRERLEIEQ